MMQLKFIDKRHIPKDLYQIIITIIIICAMKQQIKGNHLEDRGSGNGEIFEFFYSNQLEVSEVRGDKIKALLPIQIYIIQSQVLEHRTSREQHGEVAMKHAASEIKGAQRGKP